MRRPVQFVAPRLENFRKEWITFKRWPVLVERQCCPIKFGHRQGVPCQIVNHSNCATLDVFTWKESPAAAIVTVVSIVAHCEVLMFGYLIIIVLKTQC